MEQVEGGDLVVNRGNESRPKDGTATERNFNAVEGYDAAHKLAQVKGGSFPIHLAYHLTARPTRMSSSRTIRNKLLTALNHKRHTLTFTFVSNHTLQQPRFRNLGRQRNNSIYNFYYTYLITGTN